MMDSRLQDQLVALDSNLRRARLWRLLACCWLATAGAELALLLLGALTGWNTRPFWWLISIGGPIAAWVVWKRARRYPADVRAVVAVIAGENPEVRNLLSTAVEQAPPTESGEFNFLQLRVIEEALSHPDTLLWEQQTARKRSSARNRHLLALGTMIFVLLLGKYSSSLHGRLNLASLVGREIEVQPGDTQLERGSGLVFSARFGGQPPSEASVVLVWASGKTQRLALARNLADPVFGASILEVTEDAQYHVEYNGRKTRDYKIAVFDYPALTRADAELHFPGYTGLTNKIIPDTKRISAVEGTRMTYTFLLNKPVARARLLGKEQTLSLAPQTNASVQLHDLILTNSSRYALELVDAEGRTNKIPAEFVFQVLSNHPPVVKISFPRGDQRVSRLEEMQVQGEASDDFGLVKYGLGFGVAGQDPKFVELGQAAPAAEKRQFTNQITLEKLGVEVDQLITYFAWAEDYGADGNVRRTFSDIFFAEVRPFESIFRADQSGASEGRNQNGEPGGNQSPHLADLQKQIVIATWKLQQSQPAAPKESKP